MKSPFALSTSLDLAAAAYVRDPQNLPSGWTLFSPCPLFLQKMGFFAHSFINIQGKTANLIIALCGTDGIKDLLQDFEIWYGNAPSQYLEAARPYARLVLFNMQLCYPLGEYSWNIEFSGHSLGGALAQMSIANFEDYQTYIYQISGFSNTTLNPILSITARSFESPGTDEPIQSLITQGYLSNRAFFYIYNLLQNIKTSPNLINTTGSTYSPTYVIPLEGYPRNILGYLPFDPNYLKYTLAMHYVKRIQQAVEKNHITEPLLCPTPWPIGVEAGFDAFKSYSNNKRFWDDYLERLWHDNGILSSALQFVFSYDYKTFKQTYIRDMLYQNASLSYQHNKHDDASPENGVLQQKKNPEIIQNLMSKVTLSKKLHDFQTNFANKRQSAQRKNAINLCLMIIDQPQSSETFNETLAIIKDIRSQTQADHLRQFGIFAPIIGRFRHSRTVKAIDEALDAAEKFNKAK